MTRSHASEPMSGDDRRPRTRGADLQPPGADTSRTAHAEPASWAAQLQHSPRTVRQRKQVAAAFGPVAQRQEVAGVQATMRPAQLYRTVAGTGRQGGNFIYGNAQIHLHIDIGKKSHLKIEGDDPRIADQNGNLDQAKIQAALEQLLAFKDAIVNDERRAANYAQPIQDCVDWLTENGGVVPAKEKEEPKPEPKKKGPEDDAPPNRGYEDMFKNAKYEAPNEDDFM